MTWFKNFFKPKEQEDWYEQPEIFEDNTSYKTEDMCRYTSYIEQKIFSDTHRYPVSGVMPNPKPCHGDVLIKYANQTNKSEGHKI